MDSELFASNMNMERVTREFVLSLAVVLVSGFIGCGGNEDNEKLQLKNVPLEKKLADLDAGHIVGDYNDTIPHFKYLLTDLSGKFVEDQKRIASLTLAAQKMLKQKGVSESLLDIMEGINQIAYKRLENQKYKDYAAMYVKVRGNKMSHSDATGALRLLMFGEGKK